MRFDFQRLTLARRYLWGALLAALVPLVITAVLYDRYSANLLDNLITNRVEGNLESVAAKLSNFISVETNKLANIVDLPDTTLFFQSEGEPTLSRQLSDFLLLETQSPDVYAIEFSDIDGNILATIPPSKARQRPAEFATLPMIQHGTAEILGPVLPANGRPGWFLIRMPVFLDREKIGLVALRTRLASLTEQTSSLIETGVYEPQVVVFDRVRVSPVGTAEPAAEIFATSRQIMPGWRIQLVKRSGSLEEPRVQIRYVLGFVAAFAALGLIWLFISMSERVTKSLSPLTEGARAISNGNFSLRVSETGPGELGVLARSFNKMSAQLVTLINSRVEGERRASIGILAAGIAHEIRNPLTTVAATVHGLRRGEEDAERQQMLQVISEEITRADNTIGEFLRYAKPSDPVKERVLVRDVFRSVRTLTAAMAHEHDVTLNLVGDSSLKLVIDHAHLKQILLNLTLNAIEAMPEGGNLTLRTHKEDGNAVILASDTGIGLDAETQEKILRPFFTTRAGGTGLGLSISSQLVEANGGAMTIESVPSHGTTIKLTFPIISSKKQT